MERLILISIILLSIDCSCKIKQPAVVNASLNERSSTTGYSTNFMEQTTWLLGYFTRDRMTNPPHSEWFIKGYDAYQPDTISINRLKNVSRDNLTIKIILGTWCPDSRREVPRFLRIIDLWDFPVGNITFIGVDSEKIAPVGEYEKLDIQRVPTFIFYKNNIEAGRIIEVPLTSLEQDMVNILTKE